MPLFKELNILTINDLFHYQISSLMWDYDHDQLPCSLNTYFRKRKYDHGHNTRMVTADKLSIIRTNTNIYGTQGVIRLNELKDMDIYKNAFSKESFFKSLKQT